MDQSGHICCDCGLLLFKLVTGIQIHTNASGSIFLVLMYFAVLGAEHGFRLENQPTLKYLCLTLTYYTLTEPRIQGMIPNLMTYLPSLMEKIQGLETLYSAIILRGSTIFLSVCVLIPLLPQFKLVTLTLFTNVYRPWRGLKQMLETLKTELDSIKEFREASPREIEDYEDVSCQLEERSDSVPFIPECACVLFTYLCRSVLSVLHP